MAKTVVGTAVVAGGSQHIFLYNGHGHWGNRTDACQSSVRQAYLVTDIYLGVLFFFFFSNRVVWSHHRRPKRQRWKVQHTYRKRGLVCLRFEIWRDYVSRHEMGLWPQTSLLGWGADDEMTKHIGARRVFLMLITNSFVFFLVFLCLGWYLPFRRHFTTTTTTYHINSRMSIMRGFQWACN